VASSRRALRAAEGLDADSAADELATLPSEADPVGAVVETLGADSGADARLFLDCTASDAVAARYPELLRAGVSVVAANKKAFASGTHEEFEALLGAARDGGAELRFETTVGAGLPFLHTLSSLVATGDRLIRLDGVLSGTLNAVLDGLSAKVPFSRSLRQAFEAGLTEPHPGDDLSGTDVQRKLCILGRLAGFPLDLERIQVEPLVPAEICALPLESFWTRASELDEPLEERRRAAEERGERLRYLARLDERGAARVALASVGEEHAAHSLGGPDNLLALVTERYSSETPLVVRGPGAGPAVTAAGVFADLLDAVRVSAGRSAFEPNSPLSPPIRGTSQP
ncbi:MAG: bifunctional aspartate kinase/homoserine dehydrogenase I, partial [Acidobacteriota bacterium]